MNLLGLKQGPEVGKAKDLLTDIEDEYIEKGKSLSKNQAETELKEKFNI